MFVLNQLSHYHNRNSFVSFSFVQNLPKNIKTEFLPYCETLYYPWQYDLLCFVISFFLYTQLATILAAKIYTCPFQCPYIKYTLYLSVTCDWSVVFSGYSGFLHRYNWNIAESGVKHHKPTNHYLIHISESLMTLWPAYIYGSLLRSHFLLIFVFWQLVWYLLPLGCFCCWRTPFKTWIQLLPKTYSNITFRGVTSTRLNTRMVVIFMYHILIFKCPFCLSVRWTLTTKPVVFGNNITLHCKFPKYMRSCLNNAQWTGGEGNKVIAINGHSSNEAKYEMIQYDRSLDLIIKDFQATDINQRYTCVCGTLVYGKNLTANEIKFLRKHILVYGQYIIHFGSYPYYDFGVFRWPCELVYHGRRGPGLCARGMSFKDFKNLSNAICFLFFLWSFVLPRLTLYKFGTIFSALL